MLFRNFDQIDDVADIDAILRPERLNGSGVHHLVLGTGDNEARCIAERQCLFDPVLARSLGNVGIVCPYPAAAGATAERIFAAATHLVQAITRLTYQAARRVEAAVVPAQITGIVISKQAAMIGFQATLAG